MSNGFLYLLTGPSHGARLVVSLDSLRRFYSGPITVLTTQPESHQIGQLCASDPKLGIRHERIQAAAVRRNRTFVTKVAILLEPPYDSTAYLDCDTLVCDTPEELLSVGVDDQFLVPQFSNWVTTGTKISRRIRRWLNVSAEGFDIPAMVNNIISKPYPSVNNGVVAVKRGAGIVRDWFRLCLAGHRTFICDEVALHLLLPYHKHRILDGRYNNSSVYGVADGVRIWHFHGDKHTKPAKGAQVWLPAYKSCVIRKVASVQTWGAAYDTSLLGLLGEE